MCDDAVMHDDVCKCRVSSTLTSCLEMTLSELSDASCASPFQLPLLSHTYTTKTPVPSYKNTDYLPPLFLKRLGEPTRNLRATLQSFSVCFPRLPDCKHHHLEPTTRGFLSDLLV